MGDGLMIPVNVPLLNGREKDLVLECIESGWISANGPFVERFEQEFSSYLGVSGGVAVCNGTAALETALYALGVGKGDQVIVPSFTIISCALAVLRVGAVPVLADVDTDTWCLDPARVQDLVTDEVKAIMAVHMYGHPVDMDAIADIATAKGIKVLEDAAEVHGAEYRSARDDRGWIKCGAIGDAAAFSFYANKIITTGEGGMVVSRDPDVLDRARSYRNLAFRPDRRFYHTEPGYNFRMTNLQAAVGVAQLERIEEFIDIKRRWGALYRERLAEIPGVRFQVEREWAKSVYWMYSVELDPDLGIDAEDAMKRMAMRGVETRPFFRGLHRQPVLDGKCVLSRHGYPVTERAERYGFYLPSGLALAEDDVNQVCDALADVLSSVGR